MTTATPSGAASAAVAAPAAAVPSASPAAPLEGAELFQNLWDADNASAPTTSEDEGRPDLQNAQSEGESETVPEGEPAPEQIEAAKGAKPGEKPAEGEEQGKEYESLDAYLKDQQLEPESFMALPVTVKVDGKEDAVPLGELVKGYQLASASYARMNEAAQLKQTAQAEQTQFRESFGREQAQVRNALGVRIHQVETLLQSAQEQLLGEFQSITPQQWAQLRQENPGEYAALNAQFQQRQQSLQQQLQQVAAAKQQEAEQARQAALQALPQEREKLLAARPEWRDPTKGQAAQQAMMAAGQKLGFSNAELSSITDHRQIVALDMAARYAAIADAASKLGVNDTQLLEMASNYAKLQAAKPGTLKRVRAAPKMAAPGTRQVRDPKGAALQNAREAWARNPRDENAAAAVFEQLG